MASSNGLVFVPVDASNKFGSIEFLNSAHPWIVDTNRQVWTGGALRRHNHGGLRLPNWQKTTLTAQLTTSTLVFSTGKFAVWVDGVFSQFITPTAFDSRSRNYTITGLPGTGNTVEIREPWTGKPSTQNNGADGQVEGGNITGVFVPPGYTVARPTASKVIVTVGDSVMGTFIGAGANTSESSGCVMDMIRTGAHAQGALAVSLDYGGACLAGDAITAAQYATLIQQAANTAGTPTTVYVYFQVARNDWFNYGLAGVSNSPAACASFLQTIITALPAGYIKVVCTPVSQADETAKGGGFTLPNHRTAQTGLTGVTTTFQGNALGIITATHMSTDGVHFNNDANGAAGALIQYNAIKASLGL